VSNKRGHRGEREVSRKTIARGMPGRSGVTVVTTLVRFFCCARGCGCIGHPAFPAPSDFKGERFMHSSGEFTPRECKGVFDECEGPTLSLVIARLAAFAKASAGQGDRMPRRSLGVDGTGRPSIPETPENNREDAAYWVVRSSRTTTVVWEATKQSSFPVAPWIASRSLSSGAHSRDPLARNDGLKNHLGCLKREVDICEAVRGDLRGRIPPAHSS
jgi:hypothetical protein